MLNASSGVDILTCLCGTRSGGHFSRSRCLHGMGRTDRRNLIDEGL